MRPRAHRRDGGRDADGPSGLTRAVVTARRRRAGRHPARRGRPAGGVGGGRLRVDSGPVAARRFLTRPRIGRTVIRDPADCTRTDPRTGAVTSIQAAEISLPAEKLQEIWTPRDLERLARTYWRFLTRCTLGLIRVKYTEAERFVCLLFRPFVLISFQAPEYEMDATR